MELKEPKVSIDAFQLVHEGSHIVKHFVRGYTVTIDGKHYLIEKALIEFPELRLCGCKGCQTLNKRIENPNWSKIKKTVQHKDCYKHERG